MTVLVTDFKFFGMEGLGFFLFFCTLLANHVQDSEQLVITNISVPELVRLGDVDYVILDCEYDLENDSSNGLVVKWFFNKYVLLYQWIYHSPPQADPSFQKYIDLNYMATEDNYTMYRAMKLNKPDVELSGEYTCSVSTYADEDDKTASMTVYSTEDEFELLYRRKSTNESDSVEVTCTAQGLYPEPTLEISVDGLDSMQSEKPFITERNDSRFDIKTHLTLDDDDLPDPSVLKCLLSIPGANYNISQEVVYYPGTPTTTTTTKLPRKMEIQALDKSEADSANGGGSTATVTSISLVFVASQLAMLGAVIF